MIELVQVAYGDDTRAASATGGYTYSADTRLALKVGDVVLVPSTFSENYDEPMVATVVQKGSDYRGPFHQVIGIAPTRRAQELGLVVPVPIETIMPASLFLQEDEIRNLAYEVYGPKVAEKPMDRVLVSMNRVLKNKKTRKPSSPDCRALLLRLKKTLTAGGVLAVRESN